MSKSEPSRITTIWLTERDIELVVRELLIIMEKIHGKKPNHRIKLAVYYLSRDLASGRIVSGGAPVPYDAVDYRLRAKSGRRVTFPLLRALNKISKSRTQVKLLRSFMLFSAFLSYVSYTIKNRGVGRKKRKISNVETEESWIGGKGVALLLPRIYVEDYDFFARYEINSSEPIDSRDLKTGFGISYSECASNGMPVKFLQHGGNSGFTEPDFEEIESDFFYTWGWKYDNHHVPHRSRRLKQFCKHYKRLKTEKEKKLLIALPHTDLANEKQVLALSAVFRVACSFDDLKIEIRARNGGLENLLIFFPGFESSVLANRAIFFSADTSDTRPTNFEAVKSSSLIFTPYFPSSMILECICVDHPIVALLDRTDPLRSAAAQNINLLIESSILFRDIGVLEGHIFWLLQGLRQTRQEWPPVTDRRYQEFKKKYTNY